MMIGEPNLNIMSPKMILKKLYYKHNNSFTGNQKTKENFNSCY